MGKAKRVSDELSIAGQVTPEGLQQAAADGFKSVLNLRSPDEADALSDEQQQAEAAGLAYSNVPLSSNFNDSQVSEALEALEGLPKPVLIHCGAGARAGAIALIAKATQENLSPEALIAQAEQLGLSPDQPHLRQFIETHQPSASLGNSVARSRNC